MNRLEGGVPSVGRGHGVERRSRTVFCGVAIRILSSQFPTLEGASVMGRPLSPVCLSFDRCRAGEGMSNPKHLPWQGSARPSGHPQIIATPSLFSLRSPLTFLLGKVRSGTHDSHTCQQYRASTWLGAVQQSSSCGTHRREPGTLLVQLRGAPWTKRRFYGSLSR